MGENPEDFDNYVLEQLAGLGDVSSKRMFGGAGVYFEDVFFAILCRGKLFFKVDADNEPSFIERAMPPFRPNEKQTLKTYREVPLDVIENPRQLLDWARRAVRAAQK